MNPKYIVLRMVQSTNSVGQEQQVVNFLPEGSMSNGKMAVDVYDSRADAEKYIEGKQKPYVSYEYYTIIEVYSI
jgi:hypothetical protein